MALTRNDNAPRPVALLDVDGTLININDRGVKAGESILNEALLSALQEQGIKDIYLFTNMRSLDLLTAEFANEMPVSRADLITQLKERGFNVHDVITPTDLSYNKGPGAVFNEIYLPQYERIKKEIAPFYPNNPEGLKYHLDCDPVFQNALTEFNQLVKDADIVSQQFTATEGLDIQTEAEGKANFGLTGGDTGGFDIKGTLSHYFQKHKEDWVGAVVYADDDEGCLRSVENTAEKVKLNGQHYDKPATIKVTKAMYNDETKKRVCEDFVPGNFAKTKEKYSQKIAAHLTKYPDNQPAIVANKAQNRAKRSAIGYGYGIGTESINEIRGVQEETQKQAQAAKRIEDASKGLADAAIKNILACTKDIPQKLDSLGHSKHKGDAENLVAKLNSINEKNIDPRKKLPEMLKILNTEFDTGYDHAKSKFFARDNPLRDLKNHHYTRMVGFAIQVVNKLDPDCLTPDQKKINAVLEHPLILPDKNEYKDLKERQEYFLGNTNTLKQQQNASNTTSGPNEDKKDEKTTMRFGQ